MLRIPNLLDNRLTDGGEVLALRAGYALLPLPKHYFCFHQSARRDVSENRHSTIAASWCSAVRGRRGASFISTSNYCQFIMVMMLTPTNRIPSLPPTTFQHVSVCLADVRCVFAGITPPTLSPINPAARSVIQTASFTTTRQSVRIHDVGPVTKHNHTKA
jgi:hypothetical protein